MSRLTVVALAFSMLLLGACSFPDRSAIEDGDLASEEQDLWEPASWERIYFDPLDSVAVAAKLPRLRTHVLPEEHREVRIWIGGGIAYPQHLYRFVDRNGQVDGEVLWYWPVHIDIRGRPDSFHYRMMDLVRGRCEIVNVAAGMGVCRVNYTHEPDWAEVLRQAESVGLWTTVPETYVAMPDGTGATVELRTGSKYRAYEYKYNWRPKSWNHGENPSYDLSLALEMVDQLILPYTSSK